MLYAPQKTDSIPLHLQSHSLFTNGAFCLSFAPVSRMCTFTQGSFHPCQNAGSTFGAGFRVQCPWKKQVYQYGKARLVFHGWSVALFCPSAIYLYRQLLLGEDYQCLSFSKATNTDIFFYWANSALSKIAVKAMNSAIIKLHFSYCR